MVYDAAPDDESTLTIAEFERVPDDGYRHELVRGRLVREPPPGAEHGDTGAELLAELRVFVREHGLGRVVMETGFILSESPPTVRAPDVAFIAEARLPGGRLPAGYFQGAPDLAVEIVSPSNSLAEMQAKVRDYLDAGARGVWVVDPRSRTVAVHSPGEEARVLRAGDELAGGELLPGLRLAVAELFGG